MSRGFNYSKVRDPVAVDRLRLYAAGCAIQLLMT